jgi:hypothetical protein
MASEFAGTIDWDDHCARQDRASLEEIRAAGHRMVDRVRRYFGRASNSVLNVGCEPVSRCSN